MDSETAKFTSRSFSWERRLGGNAGNMANVLASEGGCAEVVLNAPSLTPRQASFLDPRIRGPDSIGKGTG